MVSKKTISSALGQVEDLLKKDQSSSAALEEENRKLKAELERLRIKDVNKEVNRPSSKQPEWESW
jgi:hypothetical protein